jgi:hypothetical protein
MSHKPVSISLLLLIASSTLVVLPAKADFSFGKTFDRVGDWATQAADKYAKVVDITDKNSDYRRILRNVDITNPNSPACNALRNGGDEAGNAAMSSGNPKAAAAGQAILIAKKTCGNPPTTQAGKDAAEQSIAAAYNIQLQIEQAKIEGDVKKTQILEDAKLKITQLQESGQTDRTRIVEENALKIALSHDATEVREAEIHLQEIQSNNWANVEMNRNNNTTDLNKTIVGKGGDIVLGVFGLIQNNQNNKKEIEIAKLKAEVERQKIENEKMRLQQQSSSALPYYVKLVGTPINPVTNSDITMLTKVFAGLDKNPQPTSCDSNPESYVTLKYGAVFAFCASPNNFFEPGSSYTIRQ